ncbi:hypothetical protein PGH07_09585 [Sulfurovum sp. zt1-1]|uniref:Lipoprotein n=1 Tax=Sulfurovum zhangzhouensis TaxID=3019067 RepID=A0ABT7R008_9BACT|nr:hypothetical protein [Sulfurovum zhangzhouensis]MDM5272430.1 hypothetical protein [Sulfurovum zhangzhouensis]
MQIYKPFISLLFVTFLLTGCEERSTVYTSFCDHGKAFSLSCLRYPMVDSQDKTVLEKALGLKEDPACPYSLKLTKYKISQCNNPVVKSTGSDFEGYVRLEIIKGFTCYYKVQSDYKLDRDRAFKRVLKQAKIDLIEKK